MTRTALHLLPAMVLAFLGAADAAAQDAHSYVVRRAQAAGPAGELGGDVLAVDDDPTPMRVVQGPELAWMVPLGDSLTLESAVLILQDNVPVEPGPGGIMIRGWRPSRAESYDTLAVDWRRGSRDRTVAGRPAHHYEMRAVIRRTAAVDGSRQRLEYTAQLWVLPDIPHSWAPFGYGTASIPARVPRLRDALDGRLRELGLVARAVIRTDYTVTGTGGTDSSSRVDAFEVSALEPADPPRSPGPVIERSTLDAVEERLATRPAPLCTLAARGQTPELLADVPPAARDAVLARINGDCGSRELYFAMVERRFQREPEVVCRAAGADADPAAFAEQALDADQRAAFMELLSDADRRRVLQEVRRFCRTRGPGR